MLFDWVQTDIQFGCYGRFTKGYLVKSKAFPKHLCVKTLTLRFLTNSRLILFHIKNDKFIILFHMSDSHIIPVDSPVM